jgi:uncharacterized protein YuzE
MKVTYNPDGDKLNILFRSAPISETETHRPGLILDYDQQGRIIGLELANASEHISRPHALGFVEMVGMTGDEMGQI